MSKNIFSVLANEDSGEEGAKKLPKKEAQAKDKQLREHFSDQIQKDIVTHKRSDNPPKNKGDYAPGEKRPFERHSGTGRPAFTNDFKKGGFGKGNVGTNMDAAKDMNVNQEEGQNPQGDNTENPEKRVREEPEQIITADEYISKTGLNYNFMHPDEDIKNVKEPVITDPNLKVMSHKSKDEPFGQRKAKNPDELIRGSKNISEDQGGQRGYGKRKQSPPKQKRIEMNEENFPSLN